MLLRRAVEEVRTLWTKKDPDFMDTYYSLKKLHQKMEGERKVNNT
jgi:hypothetical protein